MLNNSKLRFKLSAIIVLGTIGAIALSQAPSKAEGTHQSEEHEFNVVEYVNWLSNPWGMAFLPNGDILVTEKRKKQLRIIRNGKLDESPIVGLPRNIDTGGQGGLLDVTIHPNFKENNLVYFSYSGTGKGGKGTEVARGKLSGNKLENVKTIFKVSPKTSGSHHYGSRLQFAKDHTLFITTGDRYSYLKEAQNPANHLGSVIRINDDGSIPKDNPFVGHAKFKPETYSYGHRNAQGLTLNQKDNSLWLHEHGPRGGDELNKLDKPGANYGWPKVTYGIDYSGSIISNKTKAPGIIPPVIYWKPSIAPSGMIFYAGDKFPKWQGNLFVGALAGAHLRRIVFKGDKVIKQEALLKHTARFRDVKTGPDGYIYLLTDDSEGQLLRLEPVK
ncbi:PQQ-dependent sugar dehydrogenase [Hyphomicrobiales bacterium 4NK60-0047b]